MALDEPAENEQAIQSDGFDILVADNVLPYTSGNILDWVQAYGGEGFTIEPESGSCC